MTEPLLQFIWQFKYYNKSNLFTNKGEEIHVIHPGFHNTNQGPDFLDARIKIANTILAGSIEIHINAGEWNIHKHSSDRNYNNVILHVVWINDKIIEADIPTLELNSRVSSLLLSKYESLMMNRNFIPCEEQISTVNKFTFTAWKERLIVERLQEKAGIISEKLKKYNNHWEEIFWQLLAKNFGIKINSDAFESMAVSIPLSILGKHKNQLHQLEAILMGQCGLLNKDFTDDYAQMLQKEYSFLQKKYDLKPTHIPVYFLRMRPTNFPTIRLSQLAMLINNSSHLFSIIKEALNLKEVEKLFDVTANDYWHYHYVFDEETIFKKKTIGRQMIQNIIVNTVLPFLYAYGWYNNNEYYKEKALLWATQLLPEQNFITKGFVELGIENKSAYDSQSLIQLKNKYCINKRCLECAVGNSILKKETGA
jgi:hypothetical protein